MSLLGKVLTILNALAAIVFLVLAGMDYRARNDWSYAVFRHQLAIHGLPLDDRDDSWRPGRPIVKDVSEKTLADLFSKSGDFDKNVKTQLAAVGYAKIQALSYIDSKTDDNQKRTAVANIWLPLLKHSSLRDNARKAINDPKNTVDQLRGNIAALFDEVGQELAQPQNSKSTAEVRRMKVADLLYNLYPEDDPQLRERCLATVGLDAYIGAADRQATNLYGMITNLELAMHEESAAFVRQYQDLLPKLVLLNDQLKADRARLDQQKKLLEQHSLLYQARRAERDDLLEQIRRQSDLAAAETVSLGTLQQRLFDLQREIAAARETNEKLETQIRTKEIGR
jgi:hypothetical protein